MLANKKLKVKILIAWWLHDNESLIENLGRKEIKIAMVKIKKSYLIEMKMAIALLHDEYVTTKA